MNRLVTLVGRAPECKIRLSADDIATCHCGLVLTPSGLWVVDLSGRGVVVDGERMRVSPLPHGAELTIGRFQIGIQIRRARSSEASRGLAIHLPNTQMAPPAPIPTSPAADRIPPADDEVPLGVAPPSDPAAGLPSSHIMADAFHLWGTGFEGVSHPILVSGSGPPPLARPLAPRSGPAVPAPATPAERHGSENGPAAGPAAIGSTGASAAPTATVAALLSELGELHGQMLTQFEQSLGIMVRLFACLGPEQLPAMQKELARIQELNSELGKLQAELARRAAKPRPIPPAPLPTMSPSPDSTALHDWVADRIGSLQKERQARWQSLVGMFAVAERGGE